MQKFDTEITEQFEEMSKHDAYQQFSFVTAQDVFGAMLPKQTELDDDDLLWAKEQPNLSRIIRSVGNEL